MFDDEGSEVCRSMTPLKKSKVEPFCVSRTKFVERWSKYVTELTIEDDLEESLSSSGIDSDDDKNCSSYGYQTSSTDSDVSVTACASGLEKKEGNSVAGIQDKILRESFLGTFDVHINNLAAPHPSRATRVLHHEHVGTLTESFQDQDCGQLVILIGMLTCMVPTDSLAEEGSTSVEVLGGNHTRQALQSLMQKGSLTTHTVKVNLYKPLPLTAALAIGYQHNALLHERKRPMCFMDKVRLMRQCRPASEMSKRQMNEWKDMLVVVFRAKDRRRLMAGYQQHMHMARVSDGIWAKVVRAAEKTVSINEKFFRPLMRIDDDVKVEKCLDSLIDEGPKVFNSQVKAFIDQGCVRSKKSKESVPSVDVRAQNETLNFKEKYFSLKDEHDTLQEAYEKIINENERLREELERAREAEVRGTKRPREADDLSANGFSNGEKVEAMWRDETWDNWLSAKVLKLNKNGARVKYDVDNGVSNVPFSWLRKLDL